MRRPDLSAAAAAGGLLVVREGHAASGGRVVMELVVRVAQRAAPPGAANHHSFLPEQPLGPLLPRGRLHGVSVHAALHLGAPEHYCTLLHRLWRATDIVKILTLIGNFQKKLRRDTISRDDGLQHARMTSQ